LRERLKQREGWIYVKCIYGLKFNILGSGIVFGLLRCSKDCK
jgi:hypothetical protein